MRPASAFWLSALCLCAATAGAANVSTLPPQATNSGLSRAPQRTFVTPAAPAGAVAPGALPGSSLAPLPLPQHLSTFNIVIAPDPVLAANLPALAAFNRAANQWKAFISDPITVTVDASLALLGANILGSTSPVMLQSGYNTVRNQLIADADSDDAILSSLPTAAGFQAVLPAGRTLTGNTLASKANLKAAGFPNLDLFGPSDGSITFSSTFPFDFDRSDGITAGQFDFETIAAHEIGHLLGFFSAVDDIDSGVTDVQPSILDLMRFPNAAGSKPTNAAEFATFQRSMVPGNDEITSDVANEYRMSTGVNGGDGKRASNWKANELTGTYIGIMDPTFAAGEIGPITAADRRAMDLIGYDVVVPEPASLSTVSLAGFGILSRRRRRTV